MRDDFPTGRFSLCDGFVGDLLKDLPSGVCLVARPNLKTFAPKVLSPDARRSLLDRSTIDNVIS